MHRHTAWTVLGVDPATQQAAEALAAQEGTSLGRWLQSVVAERTSAGSQPRAPSAGRQQLLPILQEMVEALGKAAKVLAADEAQTTPVRTTQSVSVRAPERSTLLQEPDTGAPSFDEIQDWLKRMEAKSPAPASIGSSVTDFAPSALRRRA
jgi:hypothetical protein